MGWYAGTVRDKQTDRQMDSSKWDHERKGLPELELQGVEFNAPPEIICVISEAVFTANHLTDTDKQNSTVKYIDYIGLQIKK